MEKTVYVFTYTAYDEEGLYTSVRVFDDFCHFGGIYKDVCGSDLTKFEEDFVIEKSDVSYHIADKPGYDYFINLDIFTQVVK